jgi:hypothetical protein
MLGYIVVKLAAQSWKSGKTSEEPASEIGEASVGNELEPLGGSVGVANVVCVETVVETDVETAVLVTVTVTGGSVVVMIEVVVEVEAVMVEDAAK